MLLELQQIVKRFDDRELFRIPLWQLHQGQRIGLIGANGSGKTTLLRILEGSCKPEEGCLKRFCTLSYFAQLSQDTVYGDGRKLRELSVAHLLEQEQISGGERQRLRLSEALSKNCHLFLLDEPTSNLDQKGIAYVKQLLQTMDSFVLVTHDQTLLQDVCNQIIELSYGTLHVYDGNYESYLRQKEALRRSQQHRYETVEKQRRKLQDAYERKIRQAAKSARKPRGISSSEQKMRGKVALRKSKDGIYKALHRQADAIATRIDQLEKVKPVDEQEAIRMNLQAMDLPQGKWLLKAQRLRVSYGDHCVLNDIHFFMKNHSRVALVGENGSGKTTLLHAIAEGNDAVWKAPRVKIGQLFQQFENLQEDKTVYENAAADSVQGDAVIRGILDRLLFRQQDLSKRVAFLSGGERMRLSFAKLMVSACNLLLLDEPTNYLDLPSIRCMTKLLQNYEGSVLFVSHDAAFIRDVATEVWRLQDGTLYLPQERVNKADKGKKDYERERETRRMILDMRRSEVVNRLLQNQGDKEVLEQEYDEIMEKLKNL
ncbi:ATP-binding cassette domain-containing protein [[Clostridium] innocuum]|nr:ATP-binding cassette domain-containing protein [[Clostridium] innocuum]